MNKSIYNLILIRSGYGLKSLTDSLSLTPDLSPGLINNPKNRALAHNSFLCDAWHSLYSSCLSVFEISGIHFVLYL